MTYQQVNFETGDPLRVDTLSIMNQNDIFNYDRLYEKPRGIVFHKEAYNSYVSSATVIGTDNTHDGTGSYQRASAVLLVEGALTIEPSRYYRVQGIIEQLYVDEGDNVVLGETYPHVVLKINDATKTKYVAQNIGTTPTSDARTSVCIWNIWESPSELKDVTQLNVSLYLKSQQGHLAKAYVSSTAKTWLTVYDMGSTLRAVTSV